MRLILLYLLCLLLTACSPSAPGPTVDDPRAYLLEALRTRDLKSWVTPYRDPDPAFANTVLDAALKSWPEWTGKPMDQKVLDRFLKTRLLSRFGAAHLRTPEARAKVRAQAKARVQDPPMAIVYDDEFSVAALDLWHLPGPWKKSGRAQTWQMQASPLSRA
ncbi:MAG TPA: hypothetical protein ENK31_00280, partial [Nannocystis exedens]|nr:hypothetical protein [Nannocystis exedens]